MRKSRFNEEQIIGILKESEAGVETRRLCRRHGITRAALPVEGEVRRDGSERGEAVAGAGGGERAAEAHRGRTGGGHSGIEGGGGKKVVSPQLRREAVLVMRLEVELSQRRACGLMETLSWDVSLSKAAVRGPATAGAAARAGRSAAQVRIPPIYADHAGARRMESEP